MKKTYFILIVLFRIIDLITTELCIVNFQEQEQNLIVKFFHLDMKSFFILEIVLAFVLAFVFLYSKRKTYYFEFKQEKFINYIEFYFFQKNKTTLKDWITFTNIKRVVVLFGSIMPVYIITTSSIFSINNIWVYLYIEGNKKAMLAYDFLESCYFFDFIIFILPVLIIVFLLYRKLKKEYLNNNY